MAKVTQYNSLSTPTSDDLLLAVDVHDLSMAASGTTKKLAMSQLFGATGPITTQIADGLFNPPNFSNWAPYFTGPTLSTEWASLPVANGGTATFPAFGGYTPTAYACPTTGAPSGNAAWVGWATARLGGVTYPVTLVKGQSYTLAFNYAGNTGQSALNWYLAAWVQTASGANYGDSRSGLVYYQNFQGSLSSGWLTKTITFTADQSGPATINIVAGGTNGTVTSGAGNSVAISGSPTIMAPVLIANIQFSNTAALGVAYADARLSYLDSFGLRHPRTESRDLATAAALIVSTTTPPINVIHGGTIMAVAASIPSFTGTGPVTIDMLLGGVSIFTGGQSPLTVSAASVSTVGSFRFPQAPIASDTQLQASVLSIGSASATGLTIGVWIDYP